ncbi:MAG: RNA polymerase sigma factor [Minisyncoccia bacterium]
MSPNDKKVQQIKLFTEIYNKEVDAIFRFALLRVSDREKAMDLTQDTFARFWDVLSGEGSSVIENQRAFIFKIVRNLIIDWYRKKKSVSLESLTEDDSRETDYLLTDKKSLNHEMSSEARYILEKISELDPMYQQVVYMRFVEDMKPKEISEIIGQSVNVVSVRITRGIEQLRKITGYEKKDNE